MSASSAHADPGDESDVHDAFVACGVDLDAFCSSAAWTRPAYRAFLPQSQGVHWRDDRASVLFRCLAGTHEGVWVPGEFVWGLASPVAGETPADCVRALTAILGAHRGGWRLAAVPGLVVDSAAMRAVGAALGARHRVAALPQTVRLVASLDEGIDGFLSRRSRKFRAGLTRDRLEGERAGVEITRALPGGGEPDEIFDRVLAIEALSWKGQTGVGISSEPMRSFVRGVWGECWRLRTGRALFAQCDGRDVGYLIGAASRDQFRGLQMSFDDARRPLALGNLLQCAAIEWAAQEGYARYDLGAEVPYKRRWAELEVMTGGFLIAPA